MSAAELEGVLSQLRAGAHYSLCGSTLTLGDASIAITGDEFDVIWDVLEEIEDDYTVSLASATDDPQGSSPKDVPSPESGAR